MIIDIHNHLGCSSDGGEAPLDVILCNMETYHIDKLILFAIDEADCGETFENSNQRIIEACQQYPDKLIPFARLMPQKGQIAIDEFKRCRKAGVKGLKLKTKDGFKPEECIPILDLIGKNDKFPVLIHVEHETEAEPKIWEPVIKEYSHIVFILAHGGKDRYRACTDMILKYPNVYVDTSTLSYNRTKWIYKRAGASKILFGSDFPYSHPAIELAKFNVLVTDPGDLEGILSRNALQILEI